MHNYNIKLQYMNDLINMFKNNLDIINIDTVTMWSNTGWSAPPGTLHGFEVNYYIEGNVNIKLGREVYTTRPGDIYFADNSEGNYCENSIFRLIYFTFTVSRHEDINRDVYLKIKECFRNLSQMHCPVKKKILEEYYIDMIKEYSLKKPGHKLKMKLLALNIFIEIFRALNSFAKADLSYKFSKYSDMVSDIISYLSENHQRDVSLAELGERYKLNPRYLNRIFKGITGFPIFQYQQRIKMEKAKRLLTSSSLSVLDIALELGFESSQYLSRIFKEMTGSTPSEYRKA